jgi:hypothetical protein
VWIVPAVLVLGMLVLALFKGLTGGGLGGPDDTIPPFDFKVTKAIPFLVTDGESAQFAGRAEEVANEVGKTMKTLYTEAFLDPKNWRDGSYDEVWPAFDEGSRATAEQDGETLTLGASAGDTYDKVTRPQGWIKVKVLLNRDDQPSTAVAIVKFTALGTGKDGTYTQIVSKGQYFLRPGGDGWTVYAFQVRRGDHETVPKPGPSGTSTEGAP